jgi:protein tyrosine phosphatase (PTP) superfamily phosphohydrolase (DUF442 family)
MKLKLIQVSLAAATLVTTFSITPPSVSAQQMIPASAVMAPMMSEPEVKANISNFAHVTNGIWRGGSPSAGAMEQLAESGVKTIIDLRMNGTGTDNEDQSAKRLGLRYVHIPMTFATPNAQQIAQFFSVVKDPAAQPIFVHCRQGADRTGTLIGMYRRLVQGWTYDQAYAEMRVHHFKPFFQNLKQLVRNCDRQYDANGIARSIATNGNPIATTAQNLPSIAPTAQK